MSERAQKALRLQLDTLLTLELCSSRITSRAGLRDCTGLDGVPGLREAAST